MLTYKVNSDGVPFEIVHNPEGSDSFQVRWTSDAFGKEITLTVSGTQLAVAAVKLKLDYSAEANDILLALARAVEDRAVQKTELLNETDSAQLRFRDDDHSPDIRNAFLVPWYVVSDYTSAIRTATRHMISVLKGGGEEPADIRVEGVEHPNWGQPWRVTLSYVDESPEPPPPAGTVVMRAVIAGEDYKPRRKRAYCTVVVDKSGEMVSFARER